MVDSVKKVVVLAVPATEVEHDVAGKPQLPELCHILVHSHIDHGGPWMDGLSASVGGKEEGVMDGGEQLL